MEIDNNTLMISSEKEEEREETRKKDNYVRKEFNNIVVYLRCNPEVELQRIKKISPSFRIVFNGFGYRSSVRIIY